MKVANPNNLPTLDYRMAKPLQGNLKDLSQKNYDKLKNVLERRGFEVPLFIWMNEKVPYLMDGHQRQRVMLKEDMQPYEVPYILIEAKDEKEAKAKLLEITSQYGTITQEGFDEFIVDLPEAEIVEAVHFDALPYLGKDDKEVTEDEPPEVSSEPAKSKLGEIYQLGRHRLMCGDSTNSDDVFLLMEFGRVKGDMVFTDPPYGINIITNTPMVGADFGVAAKGQYRKVEGDDSTDAALGAYGVFKSIKKQIIWGGNYFKFLPHSDSWLVWDKRDDSGIRNSFADAELAWCSFHTPVRVYRHLRNGMIRADRDERLHPTQKPIKVLANIIKDFSEKADVILDPFGGSGSTLIACEQLNRICYMMELDPKYCDVIRRRYHKFVNDGDETGWEEATPIQTGEKQAITP